MLDVRPAVGIDEAKNGLLAHTKLQFSQGYPFEAPLISFVAKKGLEQEQFDELEKRL